MASRGSSANKGRISSSSLPTPALASQLNASVMQQQLGKSPVPHVTRGRDWAPQSEGSSDDDAPRNAVQRRGDNPFQPLLDVLVKPWAELLCPMLMPASNDALVREYCDELEKDRSVLAQQNASLEKELERLKLSATKRQRGRRSKDDLLDRFLDLRVMMSTLPDGGTEDDVAIKTAWAAWDKRDRPTRERVAMRALTAKQEGGTSVTGNGSDAGSTRGSARGSASMPRTVSRNSDDVAALLAMEQPAARAAMVVEWILALLSTKQAHPESVTLDEVGPLMGLLYAFPRDERVQAAGAEALALVAMDEGDSATVSAEDLVEEGAITVLKEAMRNHRKNMHLQEQAGSALLHMASRSADVAIEIQQAGGTKAIAAAIKLHPQLRYLSAYMDELLPLKNGGR